MCMYCVHVLCACILCVLQVGMDFLEDSITSNELVQPVDVFAFNKV